MADEDTNDDVIVSLPELAEGEIKVTPAGSKVIEDASFNEDPVADLKNQFANMQGELSTVKASHQQTAQQLQDTSARLELAEKEVVNSQLDTVLSGIAAAEAESRSAKQALITASEAGDFQAQADAQERMADARARIQRLGEAKDDLEEAAKRKPAQRQPTRQQAPQRSGDAVEDFISQSGMTPKSAAFIRKHPHSVTDPKVHRKMLAAHNQAVLDDIEIESPEYFTMVEKAIKPAQQQQQRKADPAPAESGEGDGRRPSSAAAGGSGAGGGLNGGTVDVRLTKGEAASATDGTLVWNYDDPSGQKKFRKGDPIGLAEMARRKHEGKKRGLYDRNNIEA